ncbi:hypothetical protein K9M41_00190 [Candidatus Gracilibacteria bacterium]|nr:hypothetical protein [Candidatus Gracilibacteria bacterium]
MKKICAASGQEFEITESDMKFYEKIGVPIPTLCPEERLRRKTIFENQRNLYYRTCDATGKKLLSNYSPEKKIPIYGIDYWLSDKWDQFVTGRDFDFSRPFFEQFAELAEVAPRPALQRFPEYDENSDFTNYAGKNKNCYLIFDSDKNRDCYYSYSINLCESVVDCYRCDKCELCYECTDCAQCYDSGFLQDCVNCHDSFFLKSCIGCSHCFGCVNLRNKEYYFLNQKCTKEEYEEKLKGISLDNFNELQKMRTQFKEFMKKFPHKFMEGVHNENVLGNYLVNCKNAFNCFDSRNLWDCKYVLQAFDDLKDAMDCKECGDKAELLYECDICGYNVHSLRFCSHCFGVTQSDYSYYLRNSQNCFGCVGLHNAKYCILNKQYSKEEYEELKEKIIEHMKKTNEWGEFFPMKLSPFGYNETIAQDNYPLTKEEVLSKEWKWKDEELGTKYDGPKYEIPENIDDVDDDILDKILTCEKTGKNYRIVRPELEFYRKMNLPIPRVCPEAREDGRRKLRNPRKLYDRKCDECSVGFHTTYAPDRPEKIYCEKCYSECVD